MSLLNDFSIQLYSVREETDKDFFAVLKQLGDIGYTGVEFAGYNDIPAKEMKKALEENKLKSVGSHISLEKLMNSLEQEIEYNQILGTKYIVCPSAEMETRDDALKLAATLDPIAEKLDEAGFMFAYHNHDFEFKKDHDEYLLDILFQHTCKKKVCMELDLYWAAYAGVDGLAYMEKYIGRVKMLHLKQIKDEQSKQCVDLNEGIIDFKEVITRAQKIGVKEFILEQEEFAISSWVSVKNGYEHIMSL